MDSLTSAKQHLQQLSPANRGYDTAQILELCCMEIEYLRSWRESVLDIVAKQADDESLWFHAEHISEDRLQSELRRLHAAIEAYELVHAPTRYPTTKETR